MKYDFVIGASPDAPTWAHDNPLTAAAFMNDANAYVAQFLEFNVHFAGLAESVREEILHTDLEQSLRAEALRGDQ